MRILRTLNLFITFLILVFLDLKTSAQTTRFNISQNPKFEMLLNEKRKINSAITVNDRYKVQIFYGTSEEAKKNLINFKKDFKNLDGTIVYSNPNYKVWVGTFKTRIEAERNYKDILKKYPNALLIRPNK